MSGAGASRTLGQVLDQPEGLFEWINRVILSLAALKATVDAGICERLEEGPLAPEDLAARCAMPVDKTRRIVNFLEAEGIVERLPDGRYGPTPRSRRLLEQAPVVVVQSKSAEVGPVLAEACRQGVSAYQMRYGKPVFEHFAEQPQLAASFAGMMDFLTRRVERFVFTQHTFQPFELAVDVGGSHGRLLQGLLARHPGTRGILFDLPATAAQVTHAIRAGAYGDRIDIVGGDFFQSVPAGDLYLLKMILHDWDDDECVAILRKVRAAIAPGGRIAVIDHLLPEVPAPTGGHLMDIAMMVWATGRERRLSEFEALFAAAGFCCDRVTRNPDGQSVIEAVPVT